MNEQKPKQPAVGLKELGLGQDTRPASGGWAPGDYQNTCTCCGTQFLGDKRAVVCADCQLGEAADDSAKAPLEDKTAFACSALVSRLEWTFEAESRRWLGRLRGHPDRTLFILKLTEDRDDRCHLLGGVMSDSEDRQHTRVLIHWAKMAAEWYLNDFEALLKATNAEMSHSAGSGATKAPKGN